MNEQIKFKIKERREVVLLCPNHEKGDRFNNDQKVLSYIRMELFERLKLKRLPTEEQAIKLCWNEIDQEIDSALQYLASKDHLHKVRVL